MGARDVFPIHRAYIIYDYSYMQNHFSNHANLASNQESIKLHFLLVVSSLFSVLPVIEYLAISCKNTNEKQDMVKWPGSECMKRLATRSVIS